MALTALRLAKRAEAQRAEVMGRWGQEPELLVYSRQLVLRL